MRSLRAVARRALGEADAAEDIFTANYLISASTLITAISVVACGSNAATTPTTPAAPTAALRVTIDSLGSGIAVASLSDVRFEVAVDNAVDLRDVRIDFGDGAEAMGTSVRHVYSAVGTYTAKAMSTLRTGQQVVATQSVVVRAVEGLWHHAGYNGASRRFEIRRITLQQEGQTLRGTFSMAGEPDRPIAGTLSGERQARFVADGQEFDGTVTPAVSGEGAAWSLRLQGGTASGQTFTFKPAFGEPAVPPVADLRLIRPEGFIMEGLEIGFDASWSSGQDLTYFVEYGDGEYTTQPTSQHALQREGRFNARLTVVDRFGRDAVATPRLEVDNLTIYDSRYRYTTWVSQGTNPSNGVYEFRRLYVREQHGRDFAGNYGHPGGGDSWFKGTLTGSRGIRIVLDGGGIEFTGTVRGSVEWGVEDLMMDTRGGSANGQTLQFGRYVTP